MLEIQNLGPHPFSLNQMFSKIPRCIHLKAWEVAYPLCLPSQHSPLHDEDAWSKEECDHSDMSSQCGAGLGHASRGVAPNCDEYHSVGENQQQEALRQAVCRGRDSGRRRACLGGQGAVVNSIRELSRAAGLPRQSCLVGVGAKARQLCGLTAYVRFPC